MTIIQKGELMGDLISRQVAKDYIDSQKGRPFIGCTIGEAMKIMLDEVPSAQPVNIAKLQPNCNQVASDCISRQAALEAMETWDKFGCDPDGKLVRYDDDKHYIPYVHYEDMVHAIKHLPSAQRTGRWIDKMLDHFRKYEVVCSECGARYIGNYDSYDEPYEFNYCPNCGADMRRNE